jgi:hypothetical protein
VPFKSRSGLSKTQNLNPELIWHSKEMVHRAISAIMPVRLKECRDEG